MKRIEARNLLHKIDNHIVNIRHDYIRLCNWFPANNVEELAKREAKISEFDAEREALIVCEKALEALGDD